MTTENKNDLPIEARNQEEPQGKVKFSSLFPSLLLVFQLLLLLLGVFIEHELIVAFNNFLENSKIFLNILMVIFIIWYWTKKPVFKQKDFSRKYKVTNTFICAANIILLNKLYDNSKLNELFGAAKAFFAGNLIYVFLIIVPIVAFLIARYMSKETDNEQKEKRNLPIPLPKPRRVRVAKQALTSVKRRAIHGQEAVSKAVPNNERKIFIIVFTFIAILSVLLGALVIPKLNFLTDLRNGNITKENLQFGVGVIIAVSVIVPMLFLFLAWVTRYIAKFFTRMPEYYNETGRLDKSIIESIVGLAVFLILVFAGDLFGLNSELLHEKLRVPNFLTLPFLSIFAFAFSMIFTRMFFGFFKKDENPEGKNPEDKNANVTNSIGTIASDTLERIIRICEGTIKSFFRLIYVFPDFTDSIETVLFGEDNEPNNTNPPNNSNTNNPGASNPCTNLGGGSNSGTNKAGASNTGTNNPSSGNNKTSKP